MIRTYTFYFDFGVIGYHSVDVIYELNNGENETDLSENDLPIIKDIYLDIDDEAISVKKLFSQDFKNAICYVIKESLNTKV